MNRQDISEILKRVSSLSAQIAEHINIANPAQSEFASDLGGLLSVMTAAAYENCVKEIIYSYTRRQHKHFESYALSAYSKINSKISIPDLQKYCSTFHPHLGVHFKENLREKKEKYLERTTVDICSSYAQILRWRHDFAHTGNRVTTINEVLHHHRFAKRVLYVFAESMNLHLP